MNRNEAKLKSSSWIFILALAAWAPWPARGQQTVCAKVDLKILQEGALERGAFDARMALTNSLADQALTGLSAVISVRDEAGTATDGLFFVKVASLTGATSLDGSGIVQPATTAEAHWLIVPSTGAGGTAPLGRRHYVKAVIRFTGAGSSQTLETIEVPITVKPQPLLRLQYVLPRDVSADDPLTTGTVEPAQPYLLGLRVVNEGFGPASRLSLNTGQPRIVDNSQGLAVDFKILATFVGTATVANTLQLPLGDIAPGEARLGGWQMVSNLSGRFIDFSATFSHDAGLGGALTSLVAGVSTYFLIKDVLDDRPGRDNQFDFLVSTASTLSGTHPLPDQLWSSDAADPFRVGLVSSQAVTLAGSLLSTEPALQMTFAAPAATGFYYITADDPTGGSVALSAVTRSDGKALHPRNFWQNSPYYRPDEGEAPRLIRLFDYNPTGSYVLSFKSAALEAPPDPIATLASSALPFNEARLDWTSTGEDRSSGTILNGRYFVHFSTDPAAAFSAPSAQVVVPTNTAAGVAQSLAVQGLAGNATYFFRVFTADSRLNVSGVSNGATIYTLPHPAYAALASDLSTGSFGVSWSTAVNASGTRYRVELSSEPGGSLVSSAGYAVDLASHAFSGLVPNTTYFVTSLALNGAGQGGSVAHSTNVTLAQAPLAAASPFESVFVSSAAVSWQTLDNSSGTLYDALVSAAGGPAASTQSFVGASSAVISGLSPGTLYSFSVRAVNHAGQATAAALLGSTATLASLPAGLAFAEVSPSSIAVSWSASSPDNPGGTPYRLVLSTKSDFSGTLLASDTARSAGRAMIAGLSANTTYYARVAAFNPSGAGAAVVLGSAYSAQVFAPQAEGFGLLSAASTTLTAAWGRGGNPDYAVFALSALPADGLGAGASSSTALTTATLSGLVPNTTYLLEVRAGVDASLSPAVPLGVAVTSAAPPAPAPFPWPEVAAFGLTAGWSYDFAAAAFRLEASTASDFSGAVLSSQTPGPRALSLAFTGLSHNTSYHLRVSALNWRGASSTLALGSTRTLMLAPERIEPVVLAQSSFSLSVQWGGGGNRPAAIYTLEASTAPDFTGTLASSATAALSALVPGLSLNATYHLRVRAEEDGFQSSSTPLGAAETLAEPPVALQQTFLGVFEDSATVAWAALNSPASGYALEASGYPDFSQVLSSRTANLSLSTLTVTGLIPNQGYFFRVGSLNLSHAPNYTFLGSTATRLQGAPPPPQNVRFTVPGLSTGSVSASWDLDSPASEASLAVLARDQDFAGIVSSASLPVGVQAASYGGLDPNATYYFKVKVSTAPDAVYSLIVASPTLALPAAPAGQAVGFISTASLALAWSANGNPASTLYTVEYSSSGFGQARSASAVGTSLLLAGLLPNTTYAARVAAVNHAGLRAAALDLGSASTLALPPLPAADPLAGIYITSATLRWIPRPLAPQDQAAEGYVVEASILPDFGGAALSARTGDPARDSLPVVDLTPGSTYFFRVGSLNWQGAANFLVLGSTAPAAPAAASAVVLNDAEATVVAVPPDSPAIDWVEVVAPPNTLPAGTVLSVDADPEAVPPLFSTLAHLTDLGGVVDIRTGGMQPSGFVTLGFRYDRSRLPDAIREGNLRVVTYVQERGRWEFIGSRVDRESSMVVGFTDHLSLFALVGVAAAASLDGLVVMPIPWKPGSGDPQYDAAALGFRNLTFPSRVTIYGMTGERLWRGDGDTAGDLDWLGVNQSGRRVGSGVYVAVVEGGGKKVKKRIMVIR